MTLFGQTQQINDTLPIAALDRGGRLEAALQKSLPLLINDYQPEQIWLFGSLVTGEIHEWSDIDLMVVKETDQRFLDRTKELFYLLRPEVGLDIWVYTPQEFQQLLQEQPFVQDEIVGKGKLLFCQRCL